MARRTAVSLAAFDSCLFEGNRATAGNGGSIWAEPGLPSTLAGAGYSTFRGNSATGHGGAIYGPTVFV